MAGMTFSDRLVAKTRGAPGQLYWLRPARLILLAVLAAVLAFGIAFAVGLATKTNSHPVKLSPAAALTHSTSSAVKISASAPVVAIPAMAKAPVHHVHKAVIVAPTPPPVRVKHTVTTPVYTPPTVTHTAPTPTVPTPTVPTRTQTPPSGGTTTGGGGTTTGGGGTGTVTGGG